MPSATNPRPARHLQTKRQIKQKVIVFQLGSEWYALPIETIQRILDDFSFHGELRGGQGLVRYQDETLTLIDPGSLFPGNSDNRERRYLMVCKIDQNKHIGIPVPQLPMVFEITPEQLRPVPELYQRSGLPPGVQALIYLTEQEQEVFYLDLEHLFTH